jgi:hypothetical protein
MEIICQCPPEMVNTPVPRIAMASIAAFGAHHQFMDAELSDHSIGTST